MRGLGPRLNETERKIPDDKVNPDRQCIVSPANRMAGMSATNTTGPLPLLGVASYSLTLSAVGVILVHRAQVTFHIKHAGAQQLWEL